MNIDYKRLDAKCSPPRGDVNAKPHAGMGDAQTVMPEDGMPPVSGSGRYHENDGRLYALFPQAINMDGTPNISGANTWGQSINGYLKVGIVGRRLQWVRDDAPATGQVTYFRLRRNGREQTEWMRVSMGVVAYNPAVPVAPAPNSVAAATMFMPKALAIECDFDEVEIWTSGAAVVQAVVAIGDARLLT